MSAIVIELIIKWVVGIILGAISTLFFVFRKEVKDYFSFKRRRKKKKLIKDMGIEDLEGKLEHHEAETTQEFKEHDQLYLQKLVELETKIMAILIPIQNATLSSHYDALLEKCKKYIRQGSISMDELELIERDYETYKSLNGNGHMEMWMKRVRNLPVT